ncbi:response regulator [Streptomyces sp. S6]
MPVLDGVAATRAIVAAGDAVPKVLILTTFELDEYVFAAVRAGAAGFLLKRSPPEALIEGVRTLAAGDALLGPTVTRRLLAKFAKSTPAEPSPETARRPARLTEREHGVLLLLGRVLEKLGLRDRVHAVVFVFDHGLVRPGG